jgi:hypothetical protein
MIRLGALVLAVALHVPNAGVARAQERAQDAQPENEDSRFTFYRAEDGFLRLDGRTGRVALCTRRPVGWFCQNLPEERAALEAEIARLQADNAALKRDLLAHDLPLPGRVREGPSAPTVQPKLQMPTDQEINQVMIVIENVWRRIVEMIVNVQKDLLKKS